MPIEGQALQDGVTLSLLALDESDAAWVKLSVREPNGAEGTIIDPVFEQMPASFVGDDEY